MKMRVTQMLSDFILCFVVLLNIKLRNVDSHDMEHLKLRAKTMFYHAYDNYLKFAYPFDELRPLSCDGHDTWGSFSLTLVDSLDTLVIMGNFSEFRRATTLLLSHLHPQKNVNASVFETNIRVVGGLLSAHLLSRRAGFEVEPSWPCSGPLLRQAEIFANKLLPAFDTPTGMPYGTVNFALDGVPKDETTVTCVAGIGTFILEFGTLSRLTGNPKFEAVAMRALKALWKYRSSLGLLGNHIDISSGRWTAPDATIGSGVDSYFEYLVKGAALFRLPELDSMFREYRSAIEKHLRHGEWNPIVNKDKGTISMAVFQSLESFWPGLLTLTGDIDSARRHLLAYHGIWKQYGFLPELYGLSEGKAISGRAAYPLRPELIESILYLYRATGDPALIDMGVDILTSIEISARTSCGFATVADVTKHSLQDRMESFFLAETTKYLYLLFDENNFMHQLPGEQTYLIPITRTPSGLQCYPESGGYIFNTEAHPIDPGALNCCHAQKLDELDQIGEIKTKYTGNLDEIHDPVFENLQTMLSSQSLSPTIATSNTMIYSTTNHGSFMNNYDIELIGSIDSTFNEYFQEILKTDSNFSHYVAGHNNNNNIFSWIIEKSSNSCLNNANPNIEVMNLWLDMHNFIEKSFRTIESDFRYESNQTDIMNELILNQKSPLLSCDYPPFHNHFTYAGQLVS